MSNATECTKAMSLISQRLSGRRTAVITRDEFEAIQRGFEDLIVFQETTLLKTYDDFGENHRKNR